MVRSFNTLKRELTRQRDALFMDHQQEDVVSGGFANTIQFHYLLIADTSEMSSSTVVATAATFDANQGATGTSEVYFEPRRDFRDPGRGF
jgi:hypothetical protein